MNLKRIDGHQLSRKVGEEVIILGTISKVSSSGKNLQLKTTDHVLVNVALPEPVNTEVNGYVQVEGTVQSKSTIECSKYMLFPSSMTNDFDVEQYNQLLTILNLLGPKMWKMGEETTGS